MVYTNNMKKTPNIFRLLFAIILIMGAVVNAIMLISTPELYSEFASDSFLPIYKQFWTSIVYPNLTIFVGFVILLELTIAIFLCSKGKTVKTGLLLAAIFMLALVPFWWFGASLLNLAFAVVFIWLSHYSYPTNMWDFIRGVIGKK